MADASRSAASPRVSSSSATGVFVATGAFGADAGGRRYRCDDERGGASESTWAAPRRARSPETPTARCGCSALVRDVHRGHPEIESEVVVLDAATATRSSPGSPSTGGSTRRGQGRTSTPRSAITLLPCAIRTRLLRFDTVRNALEATIPVAGRSDRASPSHSTRSTSGSTSAASPASMRRLGARSMTATVRSSGCSRTGAAPTSIAQPGRRPTC